MTMHRAVFTLFLLAVRALPAALSSADATAVLLNSRNSVGARVWAEAQATVERDARAGRPLQQFVIGVTTDDRELADRYLAASREMIRALAERKGNPLAWYLLSLEKNDMAMLERAAAGGNVQALNALGTKLMHDAIAARVSTNELSAVFRRSCECFRLATLQRDPNAYINLGTCYLRGYGCKRDAEMAFLCFRSAAQAGHPEGMDNMSSCYRFGYGVRVSEELSLYWMMKGRALRGDKAAEKWLVDRK